MKAAALQQGVAAVNPRAASEDSMRPDGPGGVEASEEARAAIVEHRAWLETEKARRVEEEAASLRLIAEVQARWAQEDEQRRKDRDAQLETDRRLALSMSEDAGSSQASRVATRAAQQAPETVDLTES